VGTLLDLNGKVVIVTGSSSGIGEATARWNGTAASTGWSSTRERVSTTACRTWTRTLRTGEPRIDIPHGPEDPQYSA
jgi:hypothetical protein